MSKIKIKILLTSLLFGLACLTSCSYEKINISLNPKYQKSNKRISLNKVLMTNESLEISGDNLDLIQNIKLRKGSIEYSTTIFLISKHKLHLKMATVIDFISNDILSLVISTANAQSTYSFNFSLCNSLLNNKQIDCTINPINNDVLTFDANLDKWVTKNIAGLNYLGLYDMSSGSLPPPANPGDYYIVSSPGSIGAVNFLNGDWVIYSASGIWEKYLNSGVSSVFGRMGSIAAQKNDYSLNLLADVDFGTPPQAQQVLTYNGAKWVAATLSNSGSESDPTVKLFAKSDLPTCSTNEYLKSDGSNLSCVVTSIFNGLANKVLVTNASGAITSSNLNAQKLDYLSQVTSDVQVQIDSKLNQASYVDWSTIGMQTIDNGRILLPVANRVLVSSTTGVLSSSTITTSEIGYLSGVNSNLQTQINQKADAINAAQTIVAAVITGLTGPINNSDAATKQYVDQNASKWQNNNSTIYYSSGSVGINTQTARASLDVNGQAIAGYSDVGNSANLNFNLGNLLETSSLPTTLNLQNINTGGSYTLVLTSPTGGNFILNSVGRSIRCLPDCPSSTIIHNSNSHTLISIVATNSNLYVSWARGF